MLLNLEVFIEILLYSQQNSCILYSVRKYVSDLSIYEIKSPNKRVFLQSLFWMFPILGLRSLTYLTTPGKELTSFLFLQRKDLGV